MKLLQAFSVVSCSLGLLTLTGCGGGGSSTDTANDIAPQPFSESGLSAGFDVEISDGTVTVTDQGISSNSTAEIEYNSNGDVQSVSVTTPKGTIDWNDNSGTINPITDNSVILVSSDDRSKLGAFSDPYNAGFDYQTFGIWFNKVDDSNRSFEAITIGTLTPDSAIPSTGSATFNGSTTGFYIDTGYDDPFLTQSDLELTADFENRNVTFTTSNTQKYNLANTAGFIDASDLDITNNTLSISEGSNKFSGQLTTDNGLTGGAEGKFYGPNAEEAGGVFSLVSTSGDSGYVGSFGAVK